ncbi:MAG TPA: hypothetical protein VIK89_10055 [Cytophagaceae bacterium]
MKLTNWLILLIALLTHSSCNNQNNIKQRKVAVIKTDTSYLLLRNGEPYYIKGVGGYDNLAIAKRMGANSIRTWDHYNAR